MDLEPVASAKLQSIRSIIERKRSKSKTQHGGVPMQSWNASIFVTTLNEIAHHLGEQHGKMMERHSHTQKLEMLSIKCFNEQPKEELESPVNALRLRRGLSWIPRVIAQHHTGDNLRTCSSAFAFRPYRSALATVLLRDIIQGILQDIVIASSSRPHQSGEWPKTRARVGSSSSRSES